MISLFASVFLFTQLIFANNPFLDESMLGSFQYLSGPNDQYQYLDCHDRSLVEIETNGSDIILSGLTQSPIIFSKIDQGKTGIPGPLFGYSETRTILSELNETQTTIKVQFRQCQSALLGALGCIGKKWRTTSWITFSKSPDQETTLQVGYQPFAQIPPETCTLQ